MFRQEDYSIVQLTDVQKSLGKLVEIVSYPLRSHEIRRTVAESLIVDVCF